MPAVSLVVRCHNEEAHIGRLLTGALRQTQVPDQIVVVDSGSSDATVAIASAFPITLVTIEPEEFSFGRALNKGLEAATGEFAVIASAHVYPVFDSWIERLTAPFADAGVALTYGRQQAPATARFSEHQLLARWFPRRSVSRQQDPFCNNANAAVRRSLWQELRYDEALTGLEDIDWAKRAMSRGYAVSYVAEAPVVHVHHESFGQVVNRYRREAIAHKQIYNEQAMSAPSAVRLAAANVLRDLRDARKEGILGWTNLIDIPRFRTAQFYGTYRGFNQKGPVPEMLRQRFYYPPDDEHRLPMEDESTGRQIDYDGPLPTQ